MKRFLSRRAFWTAIVVLLIAGGFVARLKYRQNSRETFLRQNPNIILERELIVSDFLEDNIPSGTLRWLGFDGIVGVKLESGEQLAQLVDLFDVSHVREVQLQNGTVSDDALEAFAEMPSLENLWLDGMPVTDAAIPILAKIKGLKRLSLCGTNVTGTGLVQFRDGYTPEEINVDLRLDKEETWQAILQLPELKRFGGAWMQNSESRTEERLLRIDEQLSLEYSPFLPLTFSDAGMQKLELTPDLRGLRVKSNASNPVTDVGLKNIEKLNSLRVLYLEEIDLTDEGMASLNNLPALEHLAINKPIRPESITSAGWKHLSKSKDLKHLSIIGCHLDAETIEVISSFHNLNYLTLQECEMSEGAVIDLSAFPKLNILHFENMTLTDQQIKSACITPSIATTLSIKECNFDWVNLVDSATAQTYTHLSFSRLTVTADQLKSLSRMSGLNFLDLAGCQISKEGYAILGKFKMLPRLRLSDTNITDDEIPLLAGIPTLMHLGLGGTEITDASMVQLAGMPTLTSINLANTKVTDEGVRILLEQAKGMRSTSANPPLPSLPPAVATNLGKLTYLDLTGTAITDQSIPHLRELMMFRAQGVILADTQITDAGLKEFVGMRRCGLLDLSGTAITKESVPVLEDLPLFHIRLKGTGIDPDDVSRLYRRHPSEIGAIGTRWIEF